MAVLEKKQNHQWAWAISTWMGDSLGTPGIVYPIFGPGLLLDHSLGWSLMDDASQRRDMQVLGQEPRANKDSAMGDLENKPNFGETC
jgi:hypothetical protein